MHTKTPFLHKIALILSGCLLAVVLLEAGLRVGGFTILSLQEHKNRQALKQKSAYRIMCLGESTTQNQYPSFLEYVLNQRNAGIKFSVIDKGVQGITTSGIVDKLEGDLDTYNPDILVAMMGINDEGPYAPPEAASASKAVLFFRSFRTYKLARLLWLHILAKTAGKGAFEKTHIGPANYASLEKTIKKAIALNPHNALAYIELGRLYRGSGAYLEAEEALKRAIEFDPHNDTGYFELGEFHRTRGEYLLAEEEFKKAIELNPRNDSAYVHLGWLYRTRGDPLQAEIAYKKAIELNPQNGDHYVELGRFYRSWGKSLQAEEALKKVIELTPWNEKRYIELGWFYRAQGRYPQAEEAFRKGTELYSDEGRAHATLSKLYEEIGKPELAREHFQEARRLRLENYHRVTVNNYLKLKETADKRGIRLVCAQYPMRSITPLKGIFAGDEGGLIFVDNEKIFKDAVKREGYAAYFIDMFGGDFGHCTKKGNQLLAENIADAIMKEALRK